MTQTNTSQLRSKRILSYTGGWLTSYATSKTFTTDSVKVFYKKPNIYLIQQCLGPLCTWTFHDSILIDYTIELGNLKYSYMEDELKNEVGLYLGRIGKFVRKNLKMDTYTQILFEI